MIFHFFRVMLGWIFGNKLLPQVFINMRMNVCEGCSELRHSRLRSYCGVCKCTVNARRNPFNKLAHGCEECPLRKWSQISIGGKPCD